MGPQGTRPQAKNASKNKEETVVTKAGKSLQAQKSNDLGNEANYGKPVLTYLPRGKQHLTVVSDFDAEADVSSGEDELAPKAVSDGSLKV